VYTTRADDESGLRTLDPQAMRPRWVQAHVPGQTDPLWSPSGRAIGYTRVGGPMNGTSLVQTNVWLADLAVSYDGPSPLSST
jgi:hypothetical protein